MFLPAFGNGVFFGGGEISSMSLSNSSVFHRFLEFQSDSILVRASVKDLGTILSSIFTVTDGCCDCIVVSQLCSAHIGAA